MAAPENFFIPSGLKKRILFTLAALAIYRMGVAVPTPGVDVEAMMELFSSQGGGLFGLFNTFTGGALERFSIFALGIMPYISASIIFPVASISGFLLFKLLKKKERWGARKSLNILVMRQFFWHLFRAMGWSSYLSSMSTQGSQDVHNFPPHVWFYSF